MPEGKWRKEEKTGNYTKDKNKDKNANGGLISKDSCQFTGPSRGRWGENDHTSIARFKR